MNCDFGLTLGRERTSDVVQRFRHDPWMREPMRYSDLEAGPLDERTDVHVVPRFRHDPWMIEPMWCHDLGTTLGRENRCGAMA